MATVVLTVNGLDLSGIGLYVTMAPGVFSAVARPSKTTQVLGRHGALLLPPYTSQSRKLVLKGFADPAARTVAGLQSALQQARDIFHAGLLTIATTDTAGTVRQIDGVLESFDADPRMGKLHFQSAQVADFTATIICGDPTWREVQPWSVACPTAGTRYSLALGTSPSMGWIRLMGAATNPVVTYRNAYGDPVWTLTFTTTLTGTTDWLDLDMVRGNIWQWRSGTRTSGLSLLTSGQQDWPRPFDPQDGDVTTTQWPTLETSSGSAEALYHKRHL